MSLPFHAGPIPSDVVDWRRGLSGTGRVLITAGVLILLFVAYQLWGTGIAEARSQRALKDDFEELVRKQGTPPPGSDAPEAPPATAPPPPPTGSAVAMIRIPKIGVEKAVVEGVSLSDLKKGPGHYPETPMPGQPGNAAVAGHRTTYGAPFFELDRLEVGDDILVTTLQGSFRYVVTESKVVKPRNVEVLDPTPDNRLTLTTCHPRYSASERLVVVAALQDTAAPAPPPDVDGADGPDGSGPGDGSTPPTTIPTEEVDPAGLSGEGASNRPAVLWGSLAALVWLLTWALSKRWRKWPAYALGTPVFLVVLFVFFENFSRLLPANF